MPLLTDEESIYIEVVFGSKGKEKTIESFASGVNFGCGEGLVALSSGALSFLFLLSTVIWWRLFQLFGFFFGILMPLA